MWCGPGHGAKPGPFIRGLMVRPLGLEPRTCGLRVEKRSSRPVPASPTEGQNPTFSRVDRRCCPRWNRRVSADPSFVGHFLDTLGSRARSQFALAAASRSGIAYLAGRTKPKMSPLSSSPGVPVATPTNSPVSALNAAPPLTPGPIFASVL